MKPISHVSDQADDYSKALAKCKNLLELRAVLQEYESLFPDALEAAPSSDDEFVAFMAGLKKERRGKFAGDAFITRFSPVLIPEVLLQVASVAHSFKIPWGMAFIRCCDKGYVVIDNGMARWAEGGRKNE